MATLAELMEKTYARIGEDIEDHDEEIETVVKNGINQGYMLIRSGADRRTATEEFEQEPPITLPDKFIEVIDVIHEKDGYLSKIEYVQEDSLLYFFTPLSPGKITIRAVVLPDALVNDTDVAEVRDLFVPALIAYGAYSHQLYRRKYSSAQLLLSEFNSYLG